MTWLGTAPSAPVADYGILGSVAKNNLSVKRRGPLWEDILRVAGSPHNGTLADDDLLRMLARDGNTVLLMEFVPLAIRKFARVSSR